MRLLAGLLCGVAVAAIGIWSGVDARADEVTPRVVVDRKGVTPGGTFRVGVHFTMEPGWHIYWKDPGDAGLPTKVDVVGPLEVKAQELQWPIHEEFVSGGGIKGNGYSESVLLWREMQVDTEAQLPATFEVKSSWLGCSEDLCVPGRKTFTVTIEKGGNEPTEDLELFTEWGAKLPVADGVTVTKSIH